MYNYLISACADPAQESPEIKIWKLWRTFWLDTRKRKISGFIERQGCLGMRHPVCYPRCYIHLRWRFCYNPSARPWACVWKCNWSNLDLTNYFNIIVTTRGLGDLRASTSRWRPFGPASENATDPTPVQKEDNSLEYGKCLGTGFCCFWTLSASVDPTKSV